MRRTSLAITAAVAAAALSVTACSSAQMRSEARTAPTCTEQSVPVTLDPVNTTVYHIVGWLCVPRHDAQRSRTVHLLVSGLTYSHIYWDSGYQPSTYSYVHAANERGYATFNIDRVGVGQSDHPPAEQLTLQTHAYTIAQIVKRLRDGAIGDVTFDTVVGVGHSLGAGILQYEAGTVTDRDRVPDLLVLTGYLTKTNPDVIAAIGAALYPAAEDTALARTNPPPGYLTTRPGARNLFLAPDVDPAIMALDEATKQTSSMAERSTVSAARDPNIMHAIAVPVLIIAGQHDRLACDDTLGLSCADTHAVVTREANNFSPAACLSAYVVAGAGHAINMHRNADTAYRATNDWIDDHLGMDRTQRPDRGGTCAAPTTP